MKKYFLVVISFLALFRLESQSPYAINPVGLFETDSIWDVSLTSDFNKLIRTKQKPSYFPATFSWHEADSLFSERIRIKARGDVRRQICRAPPLKLNFHNKTSPLLYPLGSLKLVCDCGDNDYFDQLVLKEYLIYKIYNLLTEKSFRVRLLNITYVEKNGRKKPSLQHAFLIEDAKDLARRNGCKEAKKMKLPSTVTDRKQMTMVALFQYMIGNTDWGVSANHNTILIQPRDLNERPFVIPHDFDYSGFVNSNYAVPSEELGLRNVTERLYRGYARSMDELKEAVSVFMRQKEKIYSLVNNFDLLSERNRRQTIRYLDDFYTTIDTDKDIKFHFIDNARRN